MNTASLQVEILINLWTISEMRHGKHLLMAEPSVCRDMILRTFSRSNIIGLALESTLGEAKLIVTYVT